MLNKIIHYSLHNRLVVLCAAFLLLIAGTYTAMNTEVDVFPDLNAPTVVIIHLAGSHAGQGAARVRKDAGVRTGRDREAV